MRVHETNAREYPMHRFILTAALTLLALPVMAAPADRAGRARNSLASHCQADCLQQNSRSGRPQPVQACQIRCAAALSFARDEGRSRAVVSGRGTRVAAEPVQLATRSSARPIPVAAQVVAGNVSVVFAARTPSAGYGMVVGTDRMTAYRLAEQRCRSTGPDCRVIAEAAGSCGAVAQGIRRSPNALFMTSDPNTYVVTSTHGGSANNPADAGADALAACRSLDRAASCRVVAAQCGTRT
jgi:hypothetical protein